MQLLQNSRSQTDTQEPQEVVGSVFQIHTAGLESVISPHVPVPGHLAQTRCYPLPLSSLSHTLASTLFFISCLSSRTQHQGPSVGGMGGWLGEGCRDGVGQETEQHSENVTEIPGDCCQLSQHSRFLPIQAGVHSTSGLRTFT